jgi:hypothetical protein
MNVQDLKKDVAYVDSVDIKVPLLFTGKTKDLGDSVVADFSPIKTKSNMNWYESIINPMVKRFDVQTGNNRISMARLEI